MLDRKTFFIREHVGFLKLADTYDILDPATREMIGIAKETPPVWVILLRFLVNKQMLPTQVHVCEGANPDDVSRRLFSIRRGFTFLRSRVEIRDASGVVVGWFKSKLLSIGGTFLVFDAQGNEVAVVKGDWKGWNFRFSDKQGNELGTVTKSWAGIGKEFFTSADSYVIALTGEPNASKALLLLAAGLAVDIVYKENR